MKRVILILAIFNILFYLVNTNAQEVYYTNLNGVQMTQIEYIKICDMLSEQKASILTQEEFDKYMQYSIVSGDEIYQRVVYQNGKVVSEEVITETEYNNAPETSTTCNPNSRADDSAYHETSYKRFSGKLLDSGTFLYIGSLTWKQVPATRSYDVFAFMTQHFNYSAVTGTQTYFVGNNYTNIYYNSGSEGYKGLSNGAGISMNLKDDTNITRYEMTLTADLTVNTSSYSAASIVTSYQHAQSSLTRAQSMSYNISPVGLGGVVHYSDSSIRAKYDAMSGITLTTPI